MRRLLPMLLGCGAAAAFGAAPADQGIRNFVACPIVRDTATVPCWLAEYDGELYFLTLQSDVSAPVNPPWLGHRVLVIKIYLIMIYFLLYKIKFQVF